MKFKIFEFKKVKSTNDTAIRLIKKNYSNGFIMSETQTFGKGQRGNKWISKKGNLFISMFFKINEKLILDKIVKLNLIIVNKTINSFINVKTDIKFPNDILIKKKKVCGILQEIIHYKEKKFLIVGTGINTNSSPNIVNLKTTSLRNRSIKHIDSNKILKDVKKAYEKFIYQIRKYSFLYLKKKLK